MIIFSFIGILFCNERKLVLSRKIYRLLLWKFIYILFFTLYSLHNSVITFELYVSQRNSIASLNCYTVNFFSTFFFVLFMFSRSLWTRQLWISIFLFKASTFLIEISTFFFYFSVKMLGFFYLFFRFSFLLCNTMPKSDVVWRALGCRRPCWTIILSQPQELFFE